MIRTGRVWSSWGSSRLSSPVVTLTRRHIQSHERESPASRQGADLHVTSRVRCAAAACLLALAVLLPAGSPAQQRPKITGISDVRIRVSAYCQTNEFYSEVLASRPGCLPGNSKSEPAGGDLTLWTGQRIALNMHSLYGPPPYPNNSLLEMVGFYTDDVRALRQYLKSRNLAVSEASGQKPGFAVRDPEGHFIEFIEGQPGAQSDRAQLPAPPQR